MDNIQSGLILLVLGMGIVFVFLILLILGTKIKSNIILKWFPEKEVIEPPKKKAGQTDVEIAIAVAMAHNKG